MQIGFFFHKVKNYMPPYVWKDITRRGKDDLKQFYYLKLLEIGLEVEEEVKNPTRQHFRAANWAVYHTAKMLGWRKRSDGVWVSESWHLYPTELYGGGEK